MEQEFTLTQKTSRGILFRGISQVVRQLIRFGIVAILANLLAPEDFGLLAMVTVFTNFFGMISDLGLNAAVIQKKELKKEEIFSVFWLIILFGIILTLIFWGLSPLIAKFYQRKELVSITIVLGVSFFLNSFASVPVALLAREMKFGLLSINEIIAVTLSGGGAIYLAFSGMGVWALVMQNIIYSFVYSMVNMYAAKYVPQFIFKISKIKDMISFGGNLILFNLVNYFARNADNLLIGKFLGSNALGYYDLAYQIMLFPLRRISWTIGEVMFPALSRVQHTLSTVRDAYLRAVRMIASITFPAMLGLWIIAPEFIKIILGSKWLPILYILRVFCLIGAFQSIATTAGWIYLSQGRADLQLKVGAVFVAIYIISFIIGLHWGINGVATAYGLSILLIAYPAFKIPFSLINLEISEFLKVLLPSIFSSLVMMLSVLIFREILLILYQSINGSLMIAEISWGVGCYFFSTLAINRSVLEEIKVFYENLKLGQK